MSRFTSAQHNNAIGRLRGGTTQQAVTRHWRLQTDHLCLWVRYNTTQSVNDRSRSGRHRATTGDQGRYIRVCHLPNWTTITTTTGTQIPELHGNFDQTVRKRLKEAGIYPQKTSATKRFDNLQWYQKRVIWMRARWRAVLFSNDSRFTCHVLIDAHNVYRRRRER